MFSALVRHFFSITLLIAATGGQASGGSVEGGLQSMRAADARVLAIGHRLAVGNAALCSRIEPLPGFGVHALSLYGGPYRAAAERMFGLGKGPAILASVPGGPADHAGLRPDDRLISLDGEAVPARPAGREPGFGEVEALLGQIERALADGEALIEVERNGEPLKVRVKGETGCSSRFHLIPSRALNALADGIYVQVTTAMVAQAADDAELAGIMAHELAHNLLRHKARLDAAGVKRGAAANIGRNARLIRETEIEADRLSIHLLDRAGYDPAAPIRFWKRFGGRGLDFMNAPTHPNWRRRVALFEAELAAVRAARRAGTASTPPFLSGVAS